jgi:hypothetical protein
MNYHANWWKNELGKSCERLNKDAKECARIHEFANACGKWNAIIKNQLEAMKAGAIKPTSDNLPDVLGKAD